MVAIAFQLSERMNAPVECVFGAMTSIDEAADWLPGAGRIENVTGGELKVGSVWRETRNMFGREATEEFEVTEIVPNERLGLYVDGTKGSSQSGEYRFS